MKVAPVTPTDAASDPAHPDHARWVKETTLAIEVKHAQRLGGTLRDAENENARLLQRMEAIARLPARQPSPRKPRAQRLKERGVKVTAPRKDIHISKLSPCGRCGKCPNCMRERRVLLIFQRSKDDTVCARLAAEMIGATLASNTGIGPFRELSKADRDRRLTATAESVCERSIARLGPWR